MQMNPVSNFANLCKVTCTPRQDALKSSEPGYARGASETVILETGEFPEMKRRQSAENLCAALHLLAGLHKVK